MSNELLDEISLAAIEAGVDVCWRQWAALGAPVATNRQGRGAAGSIIDPEALVLHTLAMAEHERRLRDLVAWWARVGSRHLSVVRMETVAEAFPEEARDGLGHFAFLAHEAGDRSWKRLSDRPSWHGAVREKGADPTLTNPPALMLRLRAGFGVGIKSDLLAVLLGFRGRRVPVRTLVQATGYTEPPLRDAARDMVRAGFIRRTGERPVRHYVDPSPWVPVLFPPHAPLETGASGEHGELPGWHFWPDLFSLLCATVSETRRLKDQAATDYVAASSLRDLFEQHRQAFERNEISVPDVSGPIGEGFVEVFRTMILGLVDWVEEAVRGSGSAARRTRR